MFAIMAVMEFADKGGSVTECLEFLGDSWRVLGVPFATVPEGAPAVLIAAGQDTAAGGVADRAGCVAIVKPHSFGDEPVQVRRFDIVVDLLVIIPISS